MKSFKQQCIELRQKDLTLNEIAEITGRNKSSVYFHIKSIPLSLKKRSQISLKNKERGAAAARSRKGVAQKPFVTFDDWTPDLVLLVSHLVFDGELRRSTVGYSNRATTLVRRVQTLMSQVYTYEPKTYQDVRSGVQGIRYYNVALAAYLIEKSHQLIKDAPMLDSECKRAFLQAFFDDEGCMDYRPKRNHRKIRGYQNDPAVLMVIQKILCTFGIEAVLAGRNEVSITGKKNLIQFQKEINFSVGVRLNPKRANSIWKKPIEKRALLRQAIASYVV